MQLDIGNEPTLRFALVACMAIHHHAGSICPYLSYSFEFWDMNYFPRFWSSPDNMQRTDRKWCIWAHYMQIAQAGSKTHSTLEKGQARVNRKPVQSQNQIRPNLAPIQDQNIFRWDLALELDSAQSKTKAMPKQVKANHYQNESNPVSFLRSSPSVMHRTVYPKTDLWSPYLSYHLRIWLTRSLSSGAPSDSDLCFWVMISVKTEIITEIQRS